MSSYSQVHNISSTKNNNVKQSNFSHLRLETFEEEKTKQQITNNNALEEGSLIVKNIEQNEEELEELIYQNNENF